MITATGERRATRRDVRQIVRWTIVHRLTLVSLYLLVTNASSVFRTAFLFDSSPALLVPLDATARANPAWLTSVATSLLRWDTLHFLGMASPRTLPLSYLDIHDRAIQRQRAGLYAEQSLAFQPGIIWLLRWMGYTRGDQGVSDWNPAQSVLYTSLTALLVSVTLPALFYLLTIRLTNDNRKTAKVAAMLSIVSFAPATLFTPTPEPFFAFFALLGHLACTVPYRQTTAWARIFDLRYLVSSIIAAFSYGLATAFRANGIVLAGFLVWRTLWTDPSHCRDTVTRMLSLVLIAPLAVIAAGPIDFYQFWAFDRMCDRQLDSFSDRPWCSAKVPNAYTFVQAEYWDVGLFRYWTVSQLPNWLLALPVLTLAATWPYSIYRSDPAFALEATLAPILPSHERVEQLVKVVQSRWPRLQRPMPVVNSAFTIRQSPVILAHAHFTVVMLAVLCLSSHVQIALRFATPGALPAVWWAAAEIMLKDRNRASQSSEEAVTQKETSLSKAIIRGMVMWSVISVLLYAGFYPPA